MPSRFILLLHQVAILSPSSIVSFLSCHRILQFCGVESERPPWRTAAAAVHTGTIRRQLTIMWSVVVVDSQSTTNKMHRFAVYFCKALCTFQPGVSVHYQEHKTARTVAGVLSDRYCYLRLAWLAAASNIGLTNTRRCTCSFELLMTDGKTVWSV